MIRRSKPLELSALKPPSPEQIARWQAKPRKALPRGKRPARIGRRGKRLERAWQECKAAVRERSGGFCEGNVAAVCPSGQHSASDVHHVYPEDRAAGLHDPRRCLHLCRVVHDWCDREPLKAKAAGILRPEASRGPERGVVSEP